MKALNLFFVILCLLVSGVQAQKEDLRKYSSSTAFVLKEGTREIGIFQPLRLGLKNGHEITTHPIFDLLIPNLKWKTEKGNLFNDWRYATEYSICYPTPLLKILTGEGIGGIRSPEFTTPNMLSIGAGVVMTKVLSGSTLFSVKGSMHFALGSGDLDPRSTIDLPLVYPRLATYFDKWSIRTGADLTGPLWNNARYYTDVDIFLMMNKETRFAIETKGMISIGQKRLFYAGYRLVYGEYPFGWQAHLLPIIEIQWNHY